jgi:DNA-directed RNA polymerase specialized sigma24 family protein
VAKNVRDVGKDDGFGKTLKALLLIEIDGMKQREQVRLLDRAGFGQSEIAEILGSTPKAISVRLAEVRKAAKTRGGKGE